MYCQSCGNEISVELKYCNRCGANLTVPEAYPMLPAKPVRLGLPTIVLGLTVTIGLAIIFSNATELAQMHLHPAAIAWMTIFGLAALFGCTALILRLLLKVLAMNRETYQPQLQLRPPVHVPAQMSAPRQQFQPRVESRLEPRLEPLPSVTENTTRTFSPVYREGSDPAAR